MKPMTVSKSIGSCWPRKIAQSSRTLAALAIVAAFMASGTFAQQGAPTAAAQSGNGHGDMMSGNHQMMAMHEQMMAEMKTMDTTLDMKVAAMNAAKGSAKVDATAAVINQMIAHQRQMMAKMMNMHENMMKGMKGMDDKSKDAHKERQQ
jgi:hypothetical protein